jgi:hypothetical protein
MAQKWRAVRGLLRLAVKYFIRWLIREMLEELRDGVIIRVVIEGRVYWLVIQLQGNEFRASGRTVIDVG